MNILFSDTTTSKDNVKVVKCLITVITPPKLSGTWSLLTQERWITKPTPFADNLTPKQTQNKTHTLKYLKKLRMFQNNLAFAMEVLKMVFKEDTPCIFLLPDRRNRVCAIVALNIFIYSFVCL